MLPPDHHQLYGAIQQKIKTLEAGIIAEGIDLVALKTNIADLQQFFQNQVLSLPLDNLPFALAQRVQSYQVEIDKQLNLLSIDLMFLQAAKQTATIEQRKKQVSDRLTTLNRYCDALLQPEESS